MSVGGVFAIQQSLGRAAIAGMLVAVLAITVPSLASGRREPEWPMARFTPDEVLVLSHVESATPADYLLAPISAEDAIRTVHPIGLQRNAPEAVLVRVTTDDNVSEPLSRRLTWMVVDFNHSPEGTFPIVLHRTISEVAGRPLSDMHVSLTPAQVADVHRILREQYHASPYVNFVDAVTGERLPQANGATLVHRCLFRAEKVVLMLGRPWLDREALKHQATCESELFPAP